MQNPLECLLLCYRGTDIIAPLAMGVHRARVKMNAYDCHCSSDDCSDCYDCHCGSDDCTDCYDCHCGSDDCAGNCIGPPVER